jgi:hypothetical protein
MKTETLTKRVEVSYETPEIRTVDVQTEGLLCASVENEDYNYWEFEW